VLGQRLRGRFGIFVLNHGDDEFHSLRSPFLYGGDFSLRGAEGQA
jgi:hypothetical protein